MQANNKRQPKRTQRGIREQIKHLKITKSYTICVNEETFNTLRFIFTFLLEEGGREGWREVVFIQDT